MKSRCSTITRNQHNGNWIVRTAARTMLRAVRFNDDDFAIPLITLSIPYTYRAPCNDHISELGDILQAEIEAARGAVTS